MATKRGAVARLYDGVIRAAKAVGAAFRLGAQGEPGMARLVGPYGGYGGPTQVLSKTEQVEHFRGWTYRCIDYIAGRLAKEAPTAVLAADPVEASAHKARTKAYLAGRTKSLPPPRAWTNLLWRRKALGPARANEEYEYLPDSHPLVRLLNDPNDPETGISLWYEAELFNCLCGEDFIWVVEDDAGRPAELWVIPSHWVRPVCLGEDRLVDYFEVGPRSGTAGLVRFDPEQVIWNRRPSPLSKIHAASPLQAAAALVDTYEKTEAARNFSLDNGAAVGGVIGVPPDTQLTQEQVDRLESRFAAKYAGVFNFNRPLILEGGATWVPAPADRELAYMQSQDQTRRYVMAHWGLDEVVLGFASVANRAAMVAAICNVNEATINPRKRARAAVLTERLARRFDERARLFWQDDTPLDPDALRQDFAAGAALFAVSANDYRTHVLGLEPWPEEVYDRPLAPAGLVTPGTDAGGWDGPGPLPGEAAHAPDDTPDAPADGAADDADLDPGAEVAGG